MQKPIAMFVCLLVAFAGASSAFEVEATIKKVDAANRRVSFAAGQQDRTATVAPDAKILSANGQELADGLASKDLKEGAVVTLSVERVENRPVIRAIRLGGGVAGGAASKEAEPTQDPSKVEKQDTSRLIPLTDLGTRDYQGFPGGLYPDGKNTRPAGHEDAGRALAGRVRPLDAEGRPSPDGKIVLLGIGFSNTVQAFNGFMQVAKGDEEINPKVVLVNGAVGGMSAAMIQDPDQGRGKQYWATVDERLEAAGVSRAQVQVVWIKETNPAPHEGGFPKYVQDLQAQLAKIVGIVHDRFPNARLAYFSSRTYGGWAMRKPGGGAPATPSPSPTSRASP